MSGVNPVILLQLLEQYDNYTAKGPRAFQFTKNERMRIHREKPEEVLRRKSILGDIQKEGAKKAVWGLLEKSLKGRIPEGVYIDPKMDNIAVPIQMTTGETGFGVLPTGSRIAIPEGKFIRAFTYWEKVNDIDLSCFGLGEDGSQMEFSWRNMAVSQSPAITFSGDQTSGYNGGSEYFDINIGKFKAEYPKARYIIFCDNVYSNSTFSKCKCRAGFMIREDDPDQVPPWKGERKTEDDVRGYFFRRPYLAKKHSETAESRIFDPKTVATSFRMTADSSFGYLFAIDLETRQMIWLNIAREGRHAVAGMENMTWLLRTLKMTETMNLGKLFRMMAPAETNYPRDADVVLTDDPGITEEWLAVGDKQPKLIRSWEYEKILSFLK